MSKDYFSAYAVGLVYASVCTNLPDEMAADILNQQHPTGIGPWKPAPDVIFADGDPNPCPCPSGQGRRHRLFCC